MVKVITYGTYDLLHYGHIKLLERAKALGDYLIVGVTADDFDKTRGKINVQQSLMERIEAVRSTGIADEIIVEEYEGQKIDDIKRFNVDIFTVGSDWIGKFDYLNEYCKVVYLPRTEGVSSSEIREKRRTQRLGLVGETDFLSKVAAECKFVNGMNVHSVFSEEKRLIPASLESFVTSSSSFENFLDEIDAIYVRSYPDKHYHQIKTALNMGKHVLCESPITLNPNECKELFELAETNGCILMEAMKTAYSTAFSRLILLAKSGRIGNILSVDSVCTSLKDFNSGFYPAWNSICDWGPTSMLPIFQLLGCNYKHKNISSFIIDKELLFDAFSKIDFIFDEGVGSIKVGKGVKSEGQLIISGTKGYIYVPSPWWKTDYFEIRYENPSENKRYFYQLDGEGIRYELVAFLKAIENGRNPFYIDKEISIAISNVLHDYYLEKDINYIKV